MRWHRGQNGCAVRACVAGACEGARCCPKLHRTVGAGTRAGMAGGSRTHHPESPRRPTKPWCVVCHKLCSCVVQAAAAAVCGLCACVLQSAALRRVLAFVPMRGGERPGTFIPAQFIHDFKDP